MWIFSGHQFFTEEWSSSVQCWKWIQYVSMSFFVSTVQCFQTQMMGNQQVPIGHNFGLSLPSPQNPSFLDLSAPNLKFDHFKTPSCWNMKKSRNRSPNKTTSTRRLKQEVRDGPISLLHRLTPFRDLEHSTVRPLSTSKHLRIYIRNTRPLDHPTVSLTIVWFFRHQEIRFGGIPNSRSAYIAVSCALAFSISNLHMRALFCS